MNAAGLTYQTLADLTGVSVDTVRDFMTGERWPRTSSQWKIEEQLHWPRGRITALAREFQEMAEGAGRRGPKAVRSAVTIDLSPLPAEDQRKVLDVFYDLILKLQDDEEAM